MNCSPSTCKAEIRRLAAELGASACGFAAAGEVDEVERARYAAWIDAGGSGEMQFCLRNNDVRNNPRLLLDDAHTVIVCAFNYYNNDCSLPLSRHISRYAWGYDYHHVVKSKLLALGDAIKGRFGGEVRAIVDSAPMRERYWAVKAGIGFTGANGQLFVKGTDGQVLGSYFFIGCLLWTGVVEPDLPCDTTCLQCGACVKACPGNALDGKGGCNAARCRSYLTIEHRGDLPEDTDLGECLYGCDICQDVCPLNRHQPQTTITEFLPHNPLLPLNEDEIENLTSSHFRKLMRPFAMSRIPLSQLLRNIHFSNRAKTHKQ